MPMSTEIRVRAPVADTRKRINWAWNDVLNVSPDGIVVAVAALIVVVLLLASLVLPQSMPTNPEFWVGP